MFKTTLWISIISCLPLLLSSGCASPVGGPPAVPMASPDEAMTWIVAESVYKQANFDLALSVNPDVILRGWFKWKNDGFGNPQTAAAAAAKGISFGTGVTCSALFQDADGMTPELFERIVARNPRNEPELAYHNPASDHYQGAIEKEEYLDYILQSVYRQIDLGATNIFLDEVNGGSSYYTGYSDQGMEEFRDFLIEKYCTGLGWTLTDSRWNGTFEVNLASDCPDGTMATFNYRSYLQRRGCAGALDPYQPSENNPLISEWGTDPGSLDHDTYLVRRNRRSWDYLCGRIRAYAAAGGKTVYITANGLNYNVDFQIQFLYRRWELIGGRLSLTPGYISEHRQYLDWSRAALGRDVPLVFFQDWGGGIPWDDDIPAEDRILWLRVYAAEIFASGAYFAWPVAGCGCKSMCTQNGTYDAIKALADWYRSNRDLYKNVEWLGESLSQTEAEIENTLFKKRDSDRRVAHFVNKRAVDHILQNRDNLSILIPSPLEPVRVWTVSPDTGAGENLSFTYGGNQVSLTLNRLTAYAVIVMDYE